MKKIFLFILLGICVSFAEAQTTSKKTVDEICGCVKKIKATLSEDEKLNQALNCMTSSATKNMEALKKEYKITNPNKDEAAKEVGGKIGAQLAKECPEMMPYFVMLTKKQQGSATPDINTDTLKLDSKVCEKFKTGKYNTADLYVNKKKTANPDQTSYTEVKDGFAYDYSENKKYVTKWSIKYTTACQWEQTFVESTDPNSPFKKGDKLKVKAIGSSKDGGLWMSTDMMGMNFIILSKKMK